MTTPHGSRWYCLQLRPGLEHTAERELLNQDYEVWFARHVERVRKGQELLRVVRPIFPGYAFIRFDLQRDRWQPSVYTPGVRRLLGTPGAGSFVPSPINVGVIEGLRSEHGEKAFDPSEQRTERLEPIAPGTEVTVLSGHLVGLRAICLHSDSKRISIMLSQFDARRVRLPRTSVTTELERIPA